MKKYIFLMAGFFLFSGQSLLAAAGAGGAGSSTFLDGYDPQVTKDTFPHYFVPFSTYFIGKREVTDSPKVMGVGWASQGLTTIRNGDLDAKHAPKFQEELDKRKADLAEPETFEVKIDDEPARRPWNAHHVSDLDVKIAEALYEVVYEKKGMEGYDQVETAVWKVLRGILEIPEELTQAAPKKVAAMDLWAFLTAIKLKIYPYDPPVERFSAPPYGPGMVPNAALDFLAERLNKLVEAYKNAKV